jgi:hypothetical protein
LLPRLRLFALLIAVTVYFGPSLRDGHSEELFSLRSLRFSAVEHDLAQFEALKKAVMVEVEGREPFRKPFLGHSRRGFCVQHRHPGFRMA